MLALAGGAVAPTSAGATRKDFFPKVISLPNGFQPEGISAGRGTSFYVGSVANGAIYRGSVRTGAGAILVPGRTGRVAGGTEVDRRNRLFVAGGPTGVGRVYDAGSGRTEVVPLYRRHLVRQRRGGDQGRRLLHRLIQPGAVRGADRPPRSARARPDATADRCAAGRPRLQRQWHRGVPRWANAAGRPVEHGPALCGFREDRVHQEGRPRRSLPAERGRPAAPRPHPVRGPQHEQ